MIYLFSILLGFSGVSGSNSTRQLLLFTSTTSQREYMKQLNLLKSDQAGLNERDIKIRIIEPKDVERSYYKVEPDEFCIILIGKDGTEKYRAYSLLTLDKLYHLVDAMPMRIQEIKSRK